MARQTGNIRITGTMDNLCFYKVKDQYYARTKSSLTTRKVKTSLRFQRTRHYAGLMACASKAASSIYRALPESFRQFWMYRAFTGEVFQYLKEGKTGEEATKVLWQTYVSVWERVQKEKQRPVKKQDRLINSNNRQNRKPRIRKVVVTGYNKKIFFIPLQSQQLPEKRSRYRKRNMLLSLSG